MLECFQAPFPYLTLVSDPDRLLEDEKILSELSQQGLQIIKLEDRALFRFEFESLCTQQRQEISYIIITQLEDLKETPFDIWSSAYKVELRKGSLLPGLASSIVRQLDTRTLDMLSILPFSKPALNEEETFNWIIEKGYKLSYDTIDSLADAILFVVRYYRLASEIPEIIKIFLIHKIKQRDLSMPVHLWIDSQVEFLNYLQQQWNTFVQEKFPSSHAFWKVEVRSLLSTLFIEGDLIPVSVEKQSYPEEFFWGISQSNQLQNIEKLNSICKQIEELLQNPLNRSAWTQIARLLGIGKNIFFDLQLTNQSAEWIDKLEKEIEVQFEGWISDHYQSLVTLTDRNAPVMVHKTIEVLRLKNQEKVALIVCDGLSFIQWAQIEKELLNDFQCEVYGSFAWIPTLTSVSRQSIFSGETPRFFYDSIHTTAKEEKAWKRAWEKGGIAPAYVTYERGLGQEKYKKERILALSKSSIKVAGLVIDTIDQLTHNAIQGQLGMHAVIDVWLKQRYIQSLLGDLLDEGFDVYLTSDHGNKESRGVGRATDGTLAETRGERVRVYRESVLRDQAAAQHTLSKAWSGTGLPDDYYVLVAPSGGAFVCEGDMIVSHGGTSLEEVVVPFVHIKKR